MIMCTGYVYNCTFKGEQLESDPVYRTVSGTN
jgi:hypothetical protein